MRERRWIINGHDLRYLLSVITDEQAGHMTDEELEDFIANTLEDENEVEDYE